MQYDQPTDWLTDCFLYIPNLAIHYICNLFHIHCSCTIRSFVHKYGQQCSWATLAIRIGHASAFEARTISVGYINAIRTQPICKVRVLPKMTSLAQMCFANMRKWRNCSPSTVHLSQATVNESQKYGLLFNGHFERGGWDARPVRCRSNVRANMCQGVVTMQSLNFVTFSAGKLSCYCTPCIVHITTLTAHICMTTLHSCTHLLTLDVHAHSGVPPQYS